MAIRHFGGKIPRQGNLVFLADGGLSNNSGLLTLLTQMKLWYMKSSVTRLVLAIYVDASTDFTVHGTIYERRGNEDDHAWTGTYVSHGKDSIEAMARAAHDAGMQAITITDHSAAATYAGGIDAGGLRAQAAEIAGLALPLRVLRGTEADILADGSIDVPEEMLGELDLVIASVHQRYKLDEDAMTARLVTAMRQPFFKIWGHALGRLVLRRDPIKVRLDEILDAIAESRAAIELNGDPYRLDLDPINARRAAARGIPFVLSCDAHSTRGLAAVRWAVAMARRARIRRDQVLNALPPEQLASRIRPAGR